MKRQTWACLVALGALSWAGACGGENDENPERVEPATSACQQITIDRFKELVVVEPSVVEDARARNDTDGPWSFRHQIEQLTPSGASPSELAYAWVSSLGQSERINLFEVPARLRTNELLLCPWLRSTPENGCDLGCTTCARRTLDLAKAPFRLIGLTNRVDLSQTDDTGHAGESRLIYALTVGPGDDPASEAQLMTVIFEYQNPTDQGRDVDYWARRWHALGTHQTFDDAFLADLEALTNDFTSRQADGSPALLNQLRFNDVALDWLWEMREYKLINGAPRLVPVHHTPDRSLNGTSELADFIRANREPVLARKFTLPSTLNGGMSRLIGVPWRVPGVDEEVRSAFAKETCDGCHQSEQRPVDQGFHVSPVRVGLDRLSPFMNNPANPDNDELSRRSTFLRSRVCTETTATTSKD